MPVELWGFPGSIRPRIANLVVAHEKLEIVSHQVDRSNKSPEFLRLFPQGKAPGLVDGDVKLTEVIAIAYYLASLNHSVTASGSLLQTAKNAIGLGQESLVGLTLADQSAILQWCSFANHEMMTALAGWFRPLLGLDPYNKKSVEDAEGRVKKTLEYLNDALLDRTFLVGERLSLADIFVAAIIMRGSEAVFDAEIRAAYPNVWRHYLTVANQPFFAATEFGGKEPTLLEKRKTYTPPAKEAKPKAEKVAAVEKPKAEKAAAKPKKDEEEEEDDVPKEVKPKHPIETLGTAKSFPIDEWKRQYSNLETPDALKWFAEHYDAQDYSLWHAVYKYPSELTQVFMSSNLITGFHTRLEGSRKFLFGNSGVYGKANDSTIQGVYMVRGPNGMHAFEVAPDAESYDFKPLEYTNPAHRKLLEEVWSWEGEMDGRPFADGKTFK